MGEVHYMISEAAKRVNVETHVLRYWEEELSLSIGRTEMGHRYYTEEDIQLFCCIKELKEQGIQLKELKGLIPDMLQTRNKLKLQKDAEKKQKDPDICLNEQAETSPKICLGKQTETSPKICLGKQTETSPKICLNKQTETSPNVCLNKQPEIPSDNSSKPTLKLEELLQNALLENNKLLEESVSQTILKEINYLFQAQDRQDEDRYKKLDHLIRQQQTYRKESSRPAPIRRLRKLFEM